MKKSGAEENNTVRYIAAILDSYYTSRKEIRRCSTVHMMSLHSGLFYIG